MIGCKLFEAWRTGQYPELDESPSPEWDARYAELTKDRWLAKKTDRARRLREHADYLLEHAPEILFRDSKGLVIDLGPGCGELLELVRHAGCDILGVDASRGFGGMGQDYLELSQMMAKRQSLPVLPCGLDGFFEGGHALLYRASAVLVNSRGSIEQMLHKHMLGERHDLHHDCRRLRWRETGATTEAFEAFFVNCRNLLVPGGILLISANGSGNDGWYDRAVTGSAREAGLRLIDSRRQILHKWLKD